MSVTELGQSQGLAWARSAHSVFTNNQLAELQQWQGGEGEKVPGPDSKPVSLEATTGPGWKNSYGPGEKLSLEGLTLTIVYDDGSRKSFTRPFKNTESYRWYFTPNEGKEITSPTKLQCDWVNFDSYETLSTTLELGYTGPIPVSIEATTGAGWKNSYGLDEKLSLNGLTLTLTYSDGSKKSSSYPFNGNEWDVWPRDGLEITGPTTLQCSWRNGAIYLTTQLEINYAGPVFKDMRVEGPTQKTYAVGEQMSLEGLVVEAQWQQPDGGLEWSPVHEKLGDVADGYNMNIDYYEITSESLPIFTDPGDHYLNINYRGKSETVTLFWMEPQPAIINITRDVKSFSPEWGSQQEILIKSLPGVNAEFADGNTIGTLDTHELVVRSVPRQIFIEARYDGLVHTVVVNAAADNAWANAKLNGIVEGHKINGYRYLYGTTQSTAKPVSDWLSITPPQR